CRGTHSLPEPGSLREILLLRVPRGIIADSGDNSLRNVLALRESFPCVSLSGARWSGGTGRRSRLKICRRSPGMGVQLPPPAPSLCLLTDREVGGAWSWLEISNLRAGMFTVRDIRHPQVTV